MTSAYTAGGSSCHCGAHASTTHRSELFTDGFLNHFAERVVDKIDNYSPAELSEVLEMYLEASSGYMHSRHGSALWVDALARVMEAIPPSTAKQIDSIRQIYESDYPENLCLMAGRILCGFSPTWLSENHIATRHLRAFGPMASLRKLCCQILERSADRIKYDASLDAITDKEFISRTIQHEVKFIEMLPDREKSLRAT